MVKQFKNFAAALICFRDGGVMVYVQSEKIWEIGTDIEFDLTGPQMRKATEHALKVGGLSERAIAKEMLGWID